MFCIFVLFVDFTVKTGPKYSAELLASVPKDKEVVMCGENMFVRLASLRHE